MEGPGLDIISPHDEINKEALSLAIRAGLARFRSKQSCFEVVVEAILTLLT